MLQECHALYWETDRPAFIAKLRELLLAKKAESEARKDSAVYIHLLFHLLCRGTATQTRAAIAEIFPQAVVTGMSEALYGNNSKESVLKLNITFMQTARVSALEYTGAPEGYAQAGEILGREIQSRPEVKAVAV